MTFGNLPGELPLLRCSCDPASGDPAGSRRTRRYITSDVPGITGWRRRKWSDGGHADWVFGAAAADTTDLQEITAGDETVRVNKTCGGVVFEWTHDLASQGYQAVQWLNHWDLTGRGMQTAHFLNLNGSGTLNPTQGGGSYGGQPAAEGREQAAAYSNADVVQGSPMTFFGVEQTTAEALVDTVRIRARCHPLDFELDSTHPVIVEGGGSGHDCLLYPTLEIGYDLTLNWRGLAGVHRWDGVFKTERAIGPSLEGQLGYHGAAMRHGYDKVYVWNARNTSGLRIDNLNVQDALPAVVIADIAQTAGESLVTITLASPHGRANDVYHFVQIADVTGTDAALINKIHNARFLGGSTLEVTLASPVTVEDLTDGSVTAAAVKYYDKAETNPRLMWVGQTNIGVVANVYTDPQGQYVGKSAFDEEGWHAMVWRADGTEAWSMAVDFAVAIFGYVTGYYDSNRRIRLFSFNTAAGSAAGTNSSAADNFHLVGCNQADTLLGQGFSLPAGEYRYTSFIVAGTWDQVLARLALLDSYVTIDGVEPTVAEPVPPY